MLNTRFFTFTILCFALLASYVTAESKAEPVASGSWIVTGTPDPASGIPEFVNFSTMTANGRIINVDPVDGTAVGDWKKTGTRKYSVTFHGFTSIDGQSMPLRVRARIQLSPNGNTFDGPFITDIFDPNGNVVFSLSGKVHGVRLKVEGI